MKVFTAEQMRAFDRAASEEYSIPSIVLMENAALRVMEFLELKFSPLRDKKIVILCGKGNNGGDGFAIARHLINGGCFPFIVFTRQNGNYKGDALTNYEALNKTQNASEEYESFDEANATNITDNFWGPLIGDRIKQADIIIDALLGTGFSDTLSEPLNRLLYHVAGSEGKRVAVDLPSGLNADTGQAAHEAVRVAHTITFAAPKRGLFLSDGLQLAGEIWVGEIGTSPWQMLSTETGCECITRRKAQELLPHRPLDAHKGTTGRVVLCGGSYGMSGAPTLAARAVLRAGAGLCIACLPDRIVPMFAAAFSEATSHPLNCDEQGQLVAEAADAMPEHWKNASAVALGPGLSRSPGALDFARRVVRECPHPLIIDADALYALRAIEEDVKKREAPTILTPHPGEMGELMEMETSAVQEDRVGTAQACAAKFNAIVVLKGSRSIVALPDGRIFFNLTGNSAMATGGSGDVLTGTIAGLLAQLKNAETATLLGVYLHGLAGDIVYSEKGNGLIAGDIAEALPLALKQIEEYSPPANTRLMRLE